MPRTFLTPPIELLSAEGGFAPLARGAGWRRPVVLLARELCSFAWFEPRAKGAAAGQAARLYARANAPYLNPGVLLRRSGSGYGVWWWDEDAVGPRLAARFGDARPHIAPETLAQPPGAALRVVRLASGFELQAWRGRALIASSWRRAPPTATDWAAFTRQHRDSDTPPAPGEPPAPQSLPVSPDFSLGGQALELTPAATARLAAGAAALVLAALAAFWAGQALRLGGLAAQMERETRVFQHKAPAARGDTGAARRIAAYDALATRPDGMAGLQTALAVVRRHGVAPRSFSIDGAEVSVTVPYAALDQVEAITQDLQATGAFAEVRPLTDAAAGSIKLEMALAGAPRPASPAG
jgi:hypothetical protein